MLANDVFSTSPAIGKEHPTSCPFPLNLSFRFADCRSFGMPGCESNLAGSLAAIPGRDVSREHVSL